MFSQPEKYKGFGDAFREVMLHEGGLPALYRGVLPALLGIVPQSAVNYYTYDTLKERYRKRTGRKHVSAPPLPVLKKMQSFLFWVRFSS